MITRLRLLVVLARPALVILVGLFAATGLAQAGHANDGLLLAEVLVAVVATLVFAVAVNDIADERIDRVNLPADTARPLVAGTTTRREMTIVAAAGAAIALGAAALVGWPSTIVVACGLAFTALYSLRPVRIAERGVIAPMLLPLGYVAVPYLLGIFAVRSTLHAQDLALLAGLYAGFVGRILLKDFRDVRGDVMFGKRTFLVRHGRRATCVLSGVFLVAGVSVLPFVRGLTVGLAVAYIAFVAVTLALLRALARSTNPRHDSALIATIAIIGRGMVVTLYVHLALVAAQWSAAAMSAVAAVLAITTIGAAHDLLRRGGPLTRTVLPFGSLVAPVLDTDPVSR